MGQVPEKVVSKLLARDDTTTGNIEDFAERLANCNFGSKELYVSLLAKAVERGTLVPIYEGTDGSTSEGNIIGYESMPTRKRREEGLEPRKLSGPARLTVKPVQAFIGGMAVAR